MSAKYRIIDFRFDTAAFADVLKRLPDADLQLFATIIDVHVNTLRNWRNGQFKEQFAYPSMTNFLNACNHFDLDPRGFFVLA